MNALCIEGFFSFVLMLNSNYISPELLEILVQYNRDFLSAAGAAARSGLRASPCDFHCS